MASSFRTELPTMAQASQHVYDVNDRIQAQLTGLWQKLEPLRGAWQGSAATSFQVVHERWQADAAKLNTALRAIGDALVGTHRNYAMTEQTNQSGISKIQASLG